MKSVYLAADNISSPLGKSTKANFEGVSQGLTSICSIQNDAISPVSFYASLFEKSFWQQTENEFTRFEKLCITSITEALKQTEISISSPDTLFILSTTKGNIELIEKTKVNREIADRVSLFKTAENLTLHFNSPNKPLVISNACISGVLAVIIAKRLLQAGKYRHAVICGADVLSRFVISGFQSLYAMSTKPCKPFDKSRDGINLGECAATMILTTEKNYSKNILINAGASTNDANHISGPSRTGLELSHAVQTAISDSSLTAKDLSFISAHGTATIYNDEMEAKAFSHASLNEVPLHSLKGNFGHTLGAAGILESVLTCHSLLEGAVLPSRNFTESGVSQTVNVNTSFIKSDKKHALKTASGFGGCNAAIIYSIN
ncbi:MAG: beta-ketoacyl synthase [Bacteroidetes bacterium]|nr:beta-ketoacyl synthase [Bacteroidota bacterium]